MSTIRGFVGTYTREESKGIYTFKLDTEKKTLSQPEVAAEAGNPTYLAVSRDNRHLYSVIRKGRAGGVAAWRIEDGRLKKSGEQLSEGAAPCYVAVDPDNRYVLSGNYHRGTADLYPVDSGTGIASPVDTDYHQGSSANPDRQEGPHVHFADFTPGQPYIVTIDLGTDQLTTYQIDGQRLKVLSLLDFPAGTGPRHIAFHPQAPVAYVVSELSNELFTLDFRAATGEFSISQAVGTLPADYGGQSSGAAVKISPDGRFVYVSNRGHNSIAVFQTEADSGKVTPAGYVSAGGSWPRDIEIDPSGHFLIAANQYSGNVVLFERDVESGRLTETGSVIQVPEAVCVKFLYES
ncbi:lactonase family protein [Sporolactobacillus sp. Y61]|uniref:Lactonase family protein n=1 Tax=Sporolactobacillus sp. Y61 TaxID=3160863 RepID=A0AAU8IGD1_9BACL